MASDRIQVLAARVRWLDRYRRLMAISAAAIIAPLIIVEFAAAAGADWPEFHGAALAVVVGVLAWWIVEVGLAWLTAVWETDHAMLLRDRDAPPRAIVVRR